MELDAKKIISIVVVVVCLAAAGIIAYKSLGGGGGTATNSKSSQMMWVKCNNPKCGHEYQMDAKEYTTLIYGGRQDGRAAMMYGPKPITCPKCGEASVFEAVKCEKCGKVFFPGAVEGQYDDKCPGCGFSKKEQAEKGTPSS